MKMHGCWYFLTAEERDIDIRGTNRREFARADTNARQKRWRFGAGKSFRVESFVGLTGAGRLALPAGRDPAEV